MNSRASSRGDRHVEVSLPCYIAEMVSMQLDGSKSRSVPRPVNRGPVPVVALGSSHGRVMQGAVSIVAGGVDYSISRHVLCETIAGVHVRL